MTIISLAPTQASQLQSLAVTKVVEGAAESQASDRTASSVLKVASGMRLSGRTAQSLTDILQSSHVNFGYSKEEAKSFSTMIDAARTYLNTIKDWAVKQAAAADDPDPVRRAINANPTDEARQQIQKVQTYDGDFIAKFEVGLAQLMSDYSNHKLVFKTFSIAATGDVNITAKTFKTTDDGKVETDSSYSFFQAQIEDPNKPKIKGPPQYGMIWSINDLTLFNSGPDRVL